MSQIIRSLVALVFVAISLAAGLAQAQRTPDQLILGPKQYLRTSGAPNEYTDTITVPSSVGAPFLLHLVNGESNGTNRISSAWITVNNVQVAGPADFGQQVAIVDRTIALNPGANTLTVKLASTPGAYLTISVYGTKILPTPTQLTPNPLNLTAGSSGTLTATIAPAPTTAGSLSVTSSNPGVAAVPSSVPLAVNQTSIAIPVTAVTVGNAQLTVTLNGGSVSATVAVSAAPPTIASLQPASATITQGGIGTLTVTISAAQSSPTTITLTSSAAGIASVPATVAVPAGQTSAAIAVAANTPGTAVITASLNGTSATSTTSTVTVTPNLPTIVSLLPPTTSINLGATGSLTVTISAIQASATTIQVTAAPTGIVTVPATVIVPAGQLTAPLPFTATALGTAMVHVSLNGSMAESAVQVTPPPPAVVSLVPSPLPVVVGANGTLTVTLNAGQLTNTEVTLIVDQPTVAQVPATVTVPAGQTHATFTVTGLAVGSATVTATLNGTAQSALVQVPPPPPQVISLLPNPLPLQQGATGSLILTINAAQLSDTVIPLTNTAPTIVQVPASMTVPANQLSATIPVTALVAGTATITAAINGSTVSSLVQVTPPPVVASLTTIPPDPPGTVLTRPKGKPGTLRVTLDRAPTDVTLVTLTSSATTVAQVPASVTVAAGALTADFPVNTVGEGTATITASLNGGSATATVTVTPAELVSLTLSPQDLTLFVGEPQQMTATGTFTDGSTQDLTTDSRLVWASTNQTVATMTSGGLVNALTIGTSTIRATFTPTTGTPTIAETTLTVLTPPALTLTATPTTVQVGQALSVTVTSARVAGVGGLPVTITSSGTGAVFHATTVTIPENQNAVSFVVTGVTAGPVTLTATAPIRTPGTLALTVTPAPPTITSFTPLTGVLGTIVTIMGTNLNGSGQGSTTVKFQNTTAVITSVTATSLVTTVPQGATDGPITVTTPGGTATSATPFDVTLSADFQILGAPGTVTTVQSHTTTAMLSLTGTAGFANLVNLTATGLPSGVTATFSAPVISPFQPVMLTLTTTGTTAPGTIPVTITGSTTVDGHPVARSTIVNLSILVAGNTSFSGRVLREQDAAPLVGVTLRLGTSTALTDVSGRFFFPSAPAGTQIMTIDGSTVAAPPGTAYSTLPVQVTLLANQHNELPFVPYLPAVDTTVFSVLDPTRDSIITTPSAPNLRFRIPAGVELRSDVDGSLITRVSVQPVSPDRIPVPAPSDPNMHVDPVTIYRFYFHKPGGAIPSQPITDFAIPNDGGIPPGTDMLVYYYDGSSTVTPGSNQWKVAGQAIVTPDGSQVVPKPGTAIPKLCCPVVYVCPALTDQFTSPNLGYDDSDDPVNLATGQFIYRKTDLVLPGRIPSNISRTYQSGRKQLAGPFGRGTSFVLERQILRIESGIVPLPAFLYVQGNGRIDTLSRQADGTYQNLVLPRLRGLTMTAGADEFVIRHRNGRVERYNISGQLIALENPNGSSLSISRDAQGQITSIANAPDRMLVFQYDGAGRITRITDPLGRTVQYTYTMANFLETVTDPAGGVTRYGYDVAGNLLGVTDARGITYVTNQYDAKDRVVQQTMGDGGVYRFQYTMFGDTITETKVIDPQGNTTTNRFSPQRFTARATNALGLVLARAFDLKNQVTETRDPQDRVTKYTYDEVGNVTSMTDPNNNVTRLEYESTFNRLTKITDALNQISEFTYDVVGNLISVKDPLNHTTTIAYNSFGQPLTVTDPLNQTTTFTYDSAGNLLTATDPLGNTTGRTYDLANRLLTLTDPRGFTTTFTYDTLNRVTHITDALNGLTSFTYDGNGNLLTVTDAKNQTTTYTYDNMDRLATRKDPLNRTESYQYDLAGNLTTFTDRKNQVTQFQYDALDRRTQATYADATTTFTYDTVGRLVKASDTATGAGTIDFGYDILDRLIQETTPQGTVAYQYDVLGRRTQMVANGQQPTSYHHDAASRLTRVAQGSLFAALGYDNANRRTSLSYSNNTTTNYAYDLASRLTGITHNSPSGIIDAITYTYDTAGNRVSLTRGNGTASLLPAAVASASYDAANEQTQFAGATLTYDNNGNLTSDDVNNYVWDARNRLVSVGGGVTANFGYDALGRRTNRSINGQARQFLYDRKDILVEVGGGIVEASYLRSLNIDESFVRQTNESIYYHADGINSSYALSQASGTLNASYSYEPFGRTAASGISSNPLQFTGREADAEGLYYYRARYYSPNRQRFLNEDPINLANVQLLRQAFPQEGFSIFSALQTQPSQYNQFVYAGNSPVNLIDPTGEIATVVGGALGGAVGGGIAGAITGAASSYLTGGTLNDALTGAATGALVGAAVGAVAGAAAGVGIPTGLTGIQGFSYIPYNPWQPFWWAFDVGLGIGEKRSLASVVGAIAGAIIDPLANPTPVHGNISGRK